MTNVRARLNKLESVGKTKPGEITCIISATVGNDDVTTCEDGSHSVLVIGGPCFKREDYESDKEFWAAVEREHQQLHGFPMDRGEECRFVTTYEDKPCA